MSHELYRKMVLLRQEVVFAKDHGPRKSVANLLLDTSGTVAMWDAVSLARELLPEISLHFSRVLVKGDPTCHVLQYVVLRPTNEALAITEPALDSWLMDNAGVQREMQVESAIASIRKSIDHLSPDGKKRAYRHLRLLNQELTSS